MKILISLFALFLSANLLAQTEQVRPIGEFSGISSASGINVQITQGEVNKVIVKSSTGDNIDRIITEVDKNGVLKIYMEYNKTKGWKNTKGEILSAYVTYQSINKISASSGATLKTTNVLKTTSLSVDASSGAVLNASVQAGDAKIEVSSGSNATLTGTASNVKIEVSSGSVFTGINLETQQCKATASSGANISIAVAKSLTAVASSGGTIKYKGNPGVDKLSTSSGGEVKKFN